MEKCTRGSGMTKMNMMASVLALTRMETIAKDIGKMESRMDRVVGWLRTVSSTAVLSRTT